MIAAKKKNQGTLAKKLTASLSSGLLALATRRIVSRMA
jgi:hypothetical protein